MLSRPPESQSSQTFSVMYQALIKHLVQYAYRVVHHYETAEDIVQECWLRLWVKQNKLLQISPQAREAYIKRCVRNACIDYVRHVQRSSLYLTDNIELIASDLNLMYEEDNIIRNMILPEEMELREMLSRIPPQEKYVVEKKLEGYSTKEISDQMNISRSTVRCYWSRARSRLRLVMKCKQP